MEFRLRSKDSDLTQRNQTEEVLRQDEEPYCTICNTLPVSIWREDWSQVIESVERVRAQGVADFAGYFRDHPEFVRQALTTVKILDINQPTLRMFAARHKQEMLSSLTAFLSTPDMLPDFAGELVALAQGQTICRSERRLTTLKGDSIEALLDIFFSPVGLSPGSVLVCVTDIGERKRAERELQKVGTELTAVRSELDAFSYSVSHDLRAPLRAIDGFSQAVVEDYGQHLPEEGLHYLQTIREGVQKMSALIDALLTFSRLSRSALNKQEVNTGNLVHSALEELNTPRNGRQIDWRIAELPACNADQTLLKHVWLNLLSNARKYTQKRERATVEIGCERKPESDVYFVRDNGVGFDMQYADKLFGVFQRLHRAEDYQGTGVGLAITKRIIERHGGRIWPEASVDRGATFYFTLAEGRRQ